MPWLGARRGEELRTACRERDLDKVAQILQKVIVNVNHQPGIGASPLRIACDSQDIPIVKILLSDPRVDPNCCNKISQYTPLFSACAKGYPEVVRVLLDHRRIDVNQPGNDGQTPLHIALALGQIGIVEMLLEHPKVDVNVFDSEGMTPLMWACRMEHFEILRMLLAHPKVDVNKPNREGKTPLHLACSADQLEVVEILGADPRVDVNRMDNKGYTPLIRACWEGKTEVVKMLIANERVEVNKPDKYGRTPLSRASVLGRVEAVKILTAEKRVDINKTDKFHFTPLLQACLSLKNGIFPYSDVWSCIEVLLACGRDIKLPSPEDEREITDKNAIQLLTTFQKTPDIIRKELAKKHRLDDLRISAAADIFAMIVFVCDELLRIKPGIEESGDQQEVCKMRYFKIATQLPMDLQMTLSNRTTVLTRDFVFVKDSTPALTRLAKKFSS